MGPGASAEPDRHWRPERDSVRCERHHRDEGPGDGIRLADLQGTNRHGRRRDRSPVAPTRGCPPGQDAHHGVRLYHTGPDAQPAQPGAHARWQFERVRGGCRGGDGTCRHRHPDRWLGRPAGILLRRDRIQDQLRPAPDGRSASVRQEPRHARILHPHGRRHARLLGGRWDIRRVARKISRWRRPTHSPTSSRPWQPRSGTRSRACVAQAS